MTLTAASAAVSSSTTEESIVKLRSLAVFGVGYVLGTRAGRERYEQIVAAAQNASKRLDDYGGKLESVSGKIDGFSGRLDGIKSQASRLQQRLIGTEPARSSSRVRDERRSLPDGVVVEATVIGRLLGLKVLRVKAHVTLMPAALEPIP